MIIFRAIVAGQIDSPGAKLFVGSCLVRTQAQLAKRMVPPGIKLAYPGRFDNRQGMFITGCNLNDARQVDNGTWLGMGLSRAVTQLTFAIVAPG